MGSTIRHYCLTLAVGFGVLLGVACQRPPATEDRDAGPVDARPPDVLATDARALDATRPEDARIPLDCPGADSDAAAAMGWKIAQNQGPDLHAVACAEGHVFIAGDQGTLLHRAPGDPVCGGFVELPVLTRDKVPTTANLLTVSFADLQYGVVAGEDPEIWESHDQGRSWNPAPQCGSVVFSAFHALHLHSATRGYGAGVARDDGGGAYKIFVGFTWICPDELFANQLFYDVFRQGDAGWVVGDTDGRIYHTDDGWSKTFVLQTGTTKPLRGVFVTDGKIGVAVGDDGVILRSADGLGMEWAQVSFFGHDDLWDVHFRDDDRGWAVGDDGTILYTADGGQTWSYQLAPTSSRLEAVCFTSDQDGWAVGQDGTILYTQTGGLYPQTGGV